MRSEKRPREAMALLGVITVFVAVGSVAHAQAYIDPGSGSYMIQVVTAGVFGVIFGLKSYWVRLRSSIGRPRHREK